MASGFLAGIFWGGVVGTGLLVVSSQTMDRQQLSFPKPQAAEVEVPGGSEFDQARVETQPLIPATEPAPSDGILSGVVAPEDAVDTPPAFDTSALDAPQPSIDGPVALGDAPEVADEIDVPAGDTSARLGSSGNVAGGPSSPALEAPDAQTAAPSADTVAPDVAAAPEAETMDVAEPRVGADVPQATSEVAAFPAEPNDEPAGGGTTEEAPVVAADDVPPASPVSPDVSDAPSLPGVRVPEPDDAPANEPTVSAQVEAEEKIRQPSVNVESDPPAAMPAPEVTDTPDSTGVVTVDGSDSQFFTPVENFQDRAEGVETDRLPTVNSGPSDERALPVVRRLPGSPVNDESEAEEETDVVGAPAAIKGPAIEAYAIDFDRNAGDSYVSIVLLHDGSDLPSEIGLERLPEQVTFAVDAGSPNAAAIASAYRSSGREVVLIPSLPTGATPQDVEIALAANLESVPEAVAVMDVSGSSFQSDREAVAQVVAVVSDTGHGLVTFPRGLNTAHQQAERANVPTGLIFRILDEDGETDEQIRRTLDRAAFRARQSDAVILVGHTRDGTMSVLSDWAGIIGEGVRLAPISAVLERN